MNTMIFTMLMTFAVPITLIMLLIVLLIFVKKYAWLKKYIPILIAAIVKTEQDTKKLPKTKVSSNKKLKTALDIAGKIEPNIKNKYLKSAIKWTTFLVPIVTKFF